MNISIASCVAVSFFLIAPPAISQDSWQNDLEWSFWDTGVPDCPEQYVAFGAAECLAMGIGGGTGVGNRQCLMARAAVMANQGQCAVAFRMALTAQCHNGGAQARLQQAGAITVCNQIAGYGNLP